jgi:hypothetical protein
LRRLVLLPVFLLCLSTTLHAQNDSDRALIKRARSLYSSGSRPAYIACDSAVDWDTFARQPGVPQREGMQQGIDLLKAMHVSFVTRGAAQTVVTVTGDPILASQKVQMRQQITAFFRAYWGLSYGWLLPSARLAYELTTTPEGYTVTRTLDNGMKESLQMDRSLAITKASSTGSTNVSELTPTFATDDDGLLHLRGVSLEARVGESRLLYEYHLDDQLAGGFYIPLHVTMSMPGALSYTHTFSNCKVFDKNSAPPQTASEPDTPK